jgi:hypothetical protein
MQYVDKMAKGGSTMVKQLTNDPKLKGSNPDTFANWLNVQINKQDGQEW